MTDGTVKSDSVSNELVPGSHFPLTLAETSTDFRFLKPGRVTAYAYNEICEYECEISFESLYIEFLDSDGDGMPDAWEDLYPECLDSFDPSDWIGDCDPGCPLPRHGGEDTAGDGSVQ